MKWGWLCGWSIDRNAFKALCRELLPGIEPVVEAPTRSGRDKLLASNVDIFAGYSLGAWLLIDAAARGWKPKQSPYLLAPFIAFPAEAGVGGRVRRSQLRVVSRNLAVDASAAVCDFSKRANLSAPTTHPPLKDEFTEGLTFLNDVSLSKVPDEVRTWHAYVGALDSLVDAIELARHWPELRIVPQAGHDPKALLAAVSAEIYNHAL
ncbi:MAG: hypothetical protein QM715_13670 [Nibricoccus sp.]